MFELIFLEYRKDIYKTRIKDLPLFSIVLLFLFTASGFGIILFAIFARNMLGFLGCYSLFAVICILVAIHDHIWKKQVRDNASTYRRETIGKLKALLNREPYHLYHAAGIDWLVSCCDQRLHMSTPKNSTSMLPFAFSIFTLAYGLVLQPLPTEHIIVTTATILAALLVLDVFNRLVVASMVERYNNPYRLIYQRLKSDLEYIKVQLHAESTPQHAPPSKPSSTSTPKRKSKH